MGLVLGVIFLAKDGATHVSANFTVVPGVILYFIALETA